MPDPNDLTTEEKEYAKQADAQWAKVAAGKLEGVAPPKPLHPTDANAHLADRRGEQFMPGQMVWHKVNGRKLDFVHSYGGLAWVQESDCTHSFVSMHNLTATDPNRPVHKFKVGDAVLLPGVVVEVDDTDLPYKVKFGEVTGPGEDYDYVWFTEAYLTEAYLVEGSR